MSTPNSLDPRILLAGVLVIACGGALLLGMWVGEGSWFFITAVSIVIGGVALLLGLGDKWWTLIPIMFAVGFSTVAPGFRLTGVDIAAMIAIGIITARIATHNASVASPRLRIGWIFYALTLYVILHAILSIVYNRYAGETQLKNVIKAYYQAVVPLVFLWLLFYYSKPNSVKTAAYALLILFVPTFLIGIVITYLGTYIPYITGGSIDFSWAGEGSIGFIRWSSIPFFLLSLTIASTVKSWPLRMIFYSLAALALVAALFGGGRVALASCFLGGVIWLLFQKRYWQLILGVIFAGLGITVINADSNSLYSLPKTVQRALTPFVIDNARSTEQVSTDLSDKWHSELRSDSWDYWSENPMSVIFGHGFQGWDDNIDIRTFTEGALFENAKKVAIQMGRTEMTFNSTLVIFGVVGIIAYYGFMFFVLWRTWNLRRLTRKGSFERAMTEFSLSVVVVSLVTTFHAGSVPGYEMVFWVFGILACREFVPMLFPRSDARESEKRLRPKRPGLEPPVLSPEARPF